MKRLFPLLIFVGAVSAAPMLRLSNSAVSTWTPADVTPASQTLQATNIGDGTLSLSVSVSPGAPWVSATIGTVEPCPAYFNGTCNAIQFTFQSASLGAGTYTASVTISDPNAVDSPQVVIVTLQVGLVIDQYVAPGGHAVMQLPFGCILGFCTPVASTTDGGGWLSVILSGAATLYYYQSIQLAPPANMPPGTYTGTVAVRGGPTLTIPVTMHVTTLPIASPYTNQASSTSQILSTNQLSVLVAQNGPATTYPFLPYISLNNFGLGTLHVTGVSGSGSGVSAYDYQGLAIVTVDPGSLAPGIYTDGVVTIQCNGANCPVQVPVSMEVDAQRPPIINYQGAVDNASFLPTGSPGDVMIVKGQQLSLQSPQTASEYPLPTTLGGASVLVNGVATPLYYSSFGQIAFQVRADTYLGTALVQVIRDGQAGNTVSMNMAQYAPGIVTVTDTSYNLVDETHPVKAGQPLVFWVLGLGPTIPAVEDGTAAPNPPATVTAPVTVVMASISQIHSSAASFAGLSPGSVGLYQVIVNAPADSGDYFFSYLTLAGYSNPSNSVSIVVQ